MNQTYPTEIQTQVEVIEGGRFHKEKRIITNVVKLDKPEIRKSINEGELVNRLVTFRPSCLSLRSDEYWMDISGMRSAFPVLTTLAYDSFWEFHSFTRFLNLEYERYDNNMSYLGSPEHLELKELLSESGKIFKCAKVFLKNHTSPLELPLTFYDPVNNVQILYPPWTSFLRECVGNIVSLSATEQQWKEFDAHVADRNKPSADPKVEILL